jgi:general secretion pathway protein A
VYERFFGFKERPFELTSDPRFLFLSPSHREALTNLDYGISGRKSVTVVIGDVGTGKTTLVRRTLALSAAKGVECAYLKNPNVTPEELSAFLGRHFNAAPDGTPRALSLELLEQELIRRWTQGRGSALIVDEAQSLSDEMFEELRLLTNLETDTEKLLPLLLVGQSELAQRLNDHKLRYLKQRISLRCVLRQLDLQETAAYIAARIHAAGGQCAAVFSREAVIAIHEASHGLPRAINVLCDNALVTAFAAGQKPVTGRTVSEVCKDFDYELAVRAEASEDDETGMNGSATTEIVTSPPADLSPPAASPAPALDDFQRRRFSIFGSGGR